MTLGIHATTPSFSNFKGVTIHLNNKTEGLFIEIETERLRIVSINSEDYTSQLTELYGNKNVNRLVSTGETFNENAVAKKVKRWIQHWTDHNPFSSYVVLQKSTGDFIGLIRVTAVKDKSCKEKKYVPGEAEMSYLSAEKYWGKGYGKEFVDAMINHLFLHLISKNYLVNGHSFTKLIATARVENIASDKILRSFMQFVETKDRYNNGPRNWYHLTY